MNAHSIRPRVIFVLIGAGLSCGGALTSSAAGDAGVADNIAVDVTASHDAGWNVSTSLRQGT